MLNMIKREVQTYGSSKSIDYNIHESEKVCKQVKDLKSMETSEKSKKVWKQVKDEAQGL